MRHSRKSRISSKSWNNLFQVGIGCLLAYFLSARAISIGYESVAFYLYLSILLFAFFYSFRRKKHWILLGMGFGILYGLTFLIRLHQTPLDEYEGIVIEAKKNYFIFLSKGRRYYVYLADHDYYFLDLIKINGYASEIATTKYECYFDFGKYLENKGVSYQIKANDISSTFSLLNLRKTEKSFLNHFPLEIASLIDAVLFSFKDSKDGILSSSASLGIYSQLSNGGIVLSAFLRMIDPMLNRHINNERLLKGIRVLLILPFLILGPSKIGVWKLLLINLSYVVFSSKEIRYGHRLLGIGMIFIIIDRYSILSSAFFYAFGLSFLFLLTNRMINKGRNEHLKKLRRRAPLESFLLPSSIQTGKISVFAPFFRLLATPIILPFVFLCFVSFLSVPFTHSITWYGNLIRKILKLFSYAELSIPWIGSNSEAVIISLYLLLLFSLLLIDSGLHHFAYKILRLSGLSVILNMIPIMNMFTKEVTFINVGQGDALIIRDGLKSVMIDTGGALSFDIAKEVDIPYLYRKRIYHLDYLISTHDDFDHSGGVASLIRNYDVNHYISKASSFPITIGDIHLENLNVYEDGGNDGSLVIYMDFIGKKFLFMGDAGTQIEKKIIEDNPSLEVDILKVGHHGSDTSTSASFIKAIKPKEAIISVGENNRYKHPSESVLETLTLYNVKIRRTDEEGSITYWG